MDVPSFAPRPGEARLLNGRRAQAEYVVGSTIFVDGGMVLYEGFV